MRTLALLFVFFSPLLLAAQKNFQSGYIVNRKGDTITGMIDYRDWSYSPTSILFKPSGNDDAKEYTVNELDFFTINGAEAFRRSIVKISVHPARLNEIGVRDTSWKMDTVFLKVLHIGKQ